MSSSELSRTNFVENFLTGVSRALFIVYLFFTPFLIEDELRRIDGHNTVAKLFLPLLALIKLFFGFIHIVLKANSKEISKLLLSMIFLSGIALHMKSNTVRTFGDIYLPSSSSASGAAPSSSAMSTMLDSVLSFIPSFLDTDRVSAGMTATVSQLDINSVSLLAYHWLVLVGVVSAVCAQMLAYADLSRVGELGLGVFYILYGVCIMTLDEVQRPFMFLLSRCQVDMSDPHVSMRIVLAIAFLCCACGATLLCRTAQKKLGVVVCVVYVAVIVYYEGQCLMLAQHKKDGLPTDLDVDLQAMLAYHNQYIYPTDYQLLRVLNLLMVLSGTLMQMLKYFNPEEVHKTQQDYSSVDDADMDAGEDVPHDDDDDDDGDGATTTEHKKTKTKTKKTKNTKSRNKKKHQ